jgi:hypothetical protein
MEDDPGAAGLLRVLGVFMSCFTMPWENLISRIFPSRKAEISKRSLRALTALMPTPLRPTLRWKASLSYFAPVLIWLAHSMSLPSGMPRP